MTLAIMALATSYLASVLYNPQIGIVCGFLVLIWHCVVLRRVVKYAKR